MRVLRFINHMLDRLVVVIGAFLGSQFPSFMHQYTQRLAGHVDELNHLLNNLRQVATYSNKTLEEYIHKFTTSTDADFSRQGEFMQTILTRWQDLSLNLDQLHQSTLWSRPYIFFKHMNGEIAHSTFYDFTPGLTLNLEGMIYTGIGLIVGYLIYQIIVKLLMIGGTRAIAIFKPNS